MARGGSGDLRSLKIDLNQLHLRVAMVAVLQRDSMRFIVCRQGAVFPSIYSHFLTVFFAVQIPS